jgi:uncharacterized protein
MKLDISYLKGVPGKEIRNLLTAKVDGINLPGYELKYLEPVIIDLTAANKGDYIYLSGEIKTSVELICGRCLKKIVYPITMPFAEKFFDEAQVSQPVDHKALEETLLDEGYLYSGNKICLDDLIVQNQILNLPLKVVCQDDCKGFCPKCGVNLNMELCQCLIEEVDPRLAVLEQLLMSSNPPKEVEK